MEINQLRVHERVTNFFIEILNKRCSELMKKGTNMWMKNILIYMIHWYLKFGQLNL